MSVTPNPLNRLLLEWGTVQGCMSISIYMMGVMDVLEKLIIFVGVWWAPLWSFWCSRVVLDPIQVFEVKWFAGMYGAATCKPHLGWSNSRTVRCLRKGRLTKNMRKKIGRRGVKSTKTYRTAKGKKGFCGSKHLKSTQNLDKAHMREASLVNFKQVVIIYILIWIAFVLFVIVWNWSKRHIEGFTLSLWLLFFYDSNMTEGMISWLICNPFVFLFDVWL